jgi:hypothetical protein
MLKMNFKLNPRNKPFHISTSTKSFPLPILCKSTEASSSLQIYVFLPFSPKQSIQACKGLPHHRKKSIQVRVHPLVVGEVSIVSSIIDKSLPRLNWHSLGHPSCSAAGARAYSWPGMYSRDGWNGPLKMRRICIE